MSYAVNFDEKTRRVLSIYELFNMEYPEGTLLVDELPDKPAVDYIVREDGALIYAPQTTTITITEERGVQKTPLMRISTLEDAQSDTDAMLVDQEYRLTVMEMGI